MRTAVFWRPLLSRKRVAEPVALQLELWLGIFGSIFVLHVSGPALRGIFALPEPGRAHRLPIFERVLYFGFVSQRYIEILTTSEINR